MDILELLTSQMNSPNALSKIGQSVGAEPDKVQQVAQLGMPAILRALGRNASTSEGATALTGALDQHQNDNVDDIDGFLNHVNTNDGSKILQHIFGGSGDSVHNQMAQTTGLQASQVSGIMTQLVPLLMGFLGQQKKQQNLDASGISGLLSGFTGQGGSSGIMGMATQMLGSNKDGNIIDDIGNILGGLGK